MSEINGPKFSVNQINFGGIQKPVPESAPQELQTEADTPKINDFSDPKAEALGRSMLFKGEDSTKADLRALIENPQIAENSDKAFETAFKALQSTGVENPYEEAVSFATGPM